MSRKMKEAPYQPSGELTRVISLANGTWAYLIDQYGKTLHMKRSDEVFVNKCAEVDEVLNGKIVRDLKKLGWDEIVDGIENGVSGTPEQAE
jgi:hypothetical protein